MKKKPRSLAVLWKALDKARASTEPKPATKAAIAKLQRSVEEVHPSILESLAIHDGGVRICGYDLLSAARIIQLDGEHLLYHGNVAFAMDGGGNDYTVNDKGKLLGIDRGATSHFVKAQSIAAWFETILAGLTKGTLVVTDDGSIDEKETPPSVPYGSETTQRIEHPFADEVCALIDAGKLPALSELLDEGTITATAHLWTSATLIGYAAGKFRLDVVKLLLERGCPIDRGSEIGRRTALFEACWGKGDANVVEFLLSRGANPNAMTSFDGTPLHAALLFDNALLAKRLVEAGADPSLENANGISARALAKKKNIAL